MTTRQQGMITVYIALFVTGASSCPDGLVCAEKALRPASPLVSLSPARLEDFPV